METKGLEKLFSERLHMELQSFKGSVLSQTKGEIFESSYKIEFYVNTYKVLLENAGDFEEDMVRSLLCMDSSILESLYLEWLTHDDGIYDGLGEYVRSEIENIVNYQNALSCRKEKINGKEIKDKAS